MRKNIDIPDEIVKDLKKMAIDADKDLKNFIQDKLCQLVNKDLITVSELETAWNKLLENKGFGYCPNFLELSFLLTFFTMQSNLLFVNLPTHSSLS